MPMAPWAKLKMPGRGVREHQPAGDHRVDRRSGQPDDREDRGTCPTEWLLVPGRRYLVEVGGHQGQVLPTSGEWSPAGRSRPVVGTTLAGSQLQTPSSVSQSLSSNFAPVGLDDRRSSRRAAGSTGRPRRRDAAAGPRRGLDAGLVDALAGDVGAAGLGRLGEQQPGGEGVEAERGVVLAVGQVLSNSSSYCGMAGTSVARNGVVAVLDVDGVGVEAGAGRRRSASGSYWFAGAGHPVELVVDLATAHRAACPGSPARRRSRGP